MLQIQTAETQLCLTHKANKLEHSGKNFHWMSKYVNDKINNFKKKTNIVLKAADLFEY